MKAREVLHLLKADGWRVARVKGSHHQLVHPAKRGVVTVAFGRESQMIPAGTVSNILKQAGLK